MELHDYPTPAQTSIFIGGYHIDDAYGISYEIQQPRVPLYSYNQAFFSQMADGKILVTGSVLINFRYPGYLAEAIRSHQALEDKAEDADRIVNRIGNMFGFNPGKVASRSFSPVIAAGEVRMNRSQLRSTLRELKGTDDPNQRLQVLALSLSNGTFREVSSLARSMFEEVGVKNPENPSQIPAREGRFEIQLVYGDDSGPIRVDILKDCYITGMGKHISSSASGHRGSVSGGPIYEVYPFVARRLDQWLVDMHTGTVREYARTQKAFTTTVKPKSLVQSDPEF